jgi:hypothetical protein
MSNELIEYAHAVDNLMAVALKATYTKGRFLQNAVDDLTPAINAVEKAVLDLNLWRAK